ncbi:murein hydrolase activator EnvC family protein [Streptomyces platensis]|uniref:murein hydrolase activator EnvC family protein n=1 Tax=Streptomyces platensis TaxID=58346 RepID=UPI0037AE7545
MRQNTRRDPRPNPRRQLLPTRDFRASFTGFRGRFPRPVGGGRPGHGSRGGRGAEPLPTDRRRPRPSPASPPSSPSSSSSSPSSSSSFPPPPGARSLSLSRPRSRPRSRCSSRRRSRFPSPAPLPPGPRGEPRGYGPSCFFPAHAACALLTPAAAAVLTLFTPPLASAAAPPVSGVAGRGVERDVDRLVAREAEGGLGLVAGRVVRPGVEKPVGLGAYGPKGRGAERPVLREVERPVGRRVDWAVVAGLGEAGKGVGLAEGGARPAPAAPPDEDRSWPVGGPAGAQPTVVRGWQPPPSPWAAGHRGVDLAASAGATVRAAAPGRVAYAGTVAGRGVLTLEVSRSGRPPLRTTYEPVRPTVRKGQRVKAGQPVAVLQDDGPFHCREPCLHWGLRRGKTYLDPLSLLPRSMLRGGPSRLLPVFGIPVPTGGATTRRQPEPPEPTAHERNSEPTAAALIEAAALAAAAIWALGRLPAARPAVGQEGPRRRRGGGSCGASSGEGVSEREIAVTAAERDPDAAVIATGRASPTR